MRAGLLARTPRGRVATGRLAAPRAARCRAAARCPRRRRHRLGDGPAHRARVRRQSHCSTRRLRRAGARLVRPLPCAPPPRSPALRRDHVPERDAPGPAPTAETDAAVERHISPGAGFPFILLALAVLLLLRHAGPAAQARPRSSRRSRPSLTVGDAGDDDHAACTAPWPASATTTVDLEIAPGVRRDRCDRQAIVRGPQPRPPTASRARPRTTPRATDPADGPDRRHALSRATTVANRSMRRLAGTSARSSRSSRPARRARSTFTGDRPRRPQLGLDLQGGTRIILTRRTPDGQVLGPDRSSSKARRDHRPAGQRPRRRRGRGDHPGRPQHRRGDARATTPTRPASWSATAQLPSGRSLAAPRARRAGAEPTAQRDRRPRRRRRHPSDGRAERPRPPPTADRGRATTLRPAPVADRAPRRPGAAPRGTPAAPAPSSAAGRPQDASRRPRSLRATLRRCDGAEQRSPATSAPTTRTTTPATCTRGRRRVSTSSARSIVEGTKIDDANAGTDPHDRRWIVSRSTSTARAARAVRRRHRRRRRHAEPFAIVLDGRVISAPTIQAAIIDGRRQITGDFTQSEATRPGQPAEVRRAAAVVRRWPTRDSRSRPLGARAARGRPASPASSASRWSSSTRWSTTALLGLVIDRLAAAVRRCSTYAAIVLLGRPDRLPLTWPASPASSWPIGITADSFIVYFERIKDEIREGRSLRSAVAARLGAGPAHDPVRRRGQLPRRRGPLRAGHRRRAGFAFTLGLTTLLDLIVVFLFTHPLVTLAGADSKFFGERPPAPAWTRRLGRRAGLGAEPRRSRRPAPSPRAKGGLTR